MGDRAKDAIRRLVQCVYEHAPPEHWGVAEEAEKLFSEIIREHEAAVRALEATRAREEALRRMAAQLEAALVNIQEEARRAQGYWALLNRRST
jgi:electron transfer flavoprotein alpha subunit